MKGNATSGNKLAFGEFGLLSLGSAWITSRQIEAARRAITHYIQRGGRVWIRIFPINRLQKAGRNKNGRRKRDVYEFVAPTKPGRILLKWAEFQRRGS